MWMGFEGEEGSEGWLPVEIIGEKARLKGLPPGSGEQNEKGARA
jgi:hypothetical protein